MAGARAEDAPHRPTATGRGAVGSEVGQRRAGMATLAHPPAAAEQHRLPPDSTTKQTLALPGRTLAFTATAGSIRLFDDKGEPQADIAYTAYQLDGADPATPAGDLPLQRRAGRGLRLSATRRGRTLAAADRRATRRLSSASPDLQPNAETWLDFTDLVFIDPVGTGYSRFVATGEDVRKRFFSIDGDVNAIAVMIRRWLEKSDRLLSPKFIVGESYGGIRGPKIVRELQIQQGVGVRGLILISPVLDFREVRGSSLLQYVASLPTMAAVAREAKGAVTRADMADVEHYARGDFLADLVKGQADAEATTRLADRVAALTGIDQAVSRRLAGRFDVSEFRREFDRRDGKVTGRYDASVMGFDPYPDSSFSHFGDPSGDPLIAPLTSAAVDLTTRKLNWRPDGSYQLLNGAVERAWDFGRGLNPVESISQLRQILALDPKLKLLVGHGLFDLATPYFGSKILLDQLPAYAFARAGQARGLSGRPHVLFARRARAQAFRAEAEALMK